MIGRYARAGVATLGMGVLAFWSNPAQGQANDALLKKLVEKGVLTTNEASDLRSELDQEAAQTVQKYNKIKLPSWINNMQLYGDARLRYEWRTGQVPSGDNTDRDRFRYRLRFGMKGTYADNFFYGFRVESSSNARSTNLTMGDNGGNPFGKANNSLYIGQAYLGWKATDWLTLTGGKVPLPFFNAPPYGAGYGFVWDPDINPEGVSEQILFKTDKIDWFVNLGEYIYKDNTENSIGGAGFSDTWMLGGQVGAKVKLDEKMYLTVAPTLYVYVQPADFNRTAVTNLAAAVFSSTYHGYPAPINKLLVFDMPAEFGFSLGSLPAKVFGEFAVNTEGSQRAKAAGVSSFDNQIYAYQAGAQLGDIKKKGDWAALAFWEHKEEFSLDPNLVDSDIFDGRLNMEGVGVNVRYAFTDFLTGAVTYSHGSHIKKQLLTAGAGDLSASDLKSYNLIQVTMDYKF